ncbi:LacI family transcriptional regulator [Bradyrhizobium japonicum]|uniref:LacI family transcriptional regulator n=1 Tax=Bradyrhizobium japonicum TaxID=375 RepID=A0A0A3XVN0_BRAJP|nr:tripartite tricarboxylate transporter substrate binding protein [Bradyrhizobium japonicum]KGT77226.1 LacI family transcriptional regulator [Bradyrhizobium japonicum]MCS3892304.1 tripartite-type tricarboxylate transporter receptor subunit TctC [Bradyrhizobium japonicum USDA 38]MCS3944818.1 tripartite-type tricarboxylate transporter receptor subunit TctC [Bradyrhizobium japonicum]MCW2222656.1 tripartite-type tricarboxylate transporter receptor subunit TctC [Bradyrhizobium japonicum]MCW2347268
MAIGEIVNHEGTRERRFAVRRWLNRAVLACAVLPVVAGLGVAPACAEYPEKIIKIVVPFAAGGGTDIIARTTAQEISTDLGKSVIIENKPGAGTIIGTQTVATGEPDGYSLLMATFAHAVNPSLYNKLPFDPHKDFAAVSLIARSFNIVVVNPASKINSIADLIVEAKANPGKLNFGTFGTGTSAHLAGELFNSMAKVKMTAVPYKGAAPAISDLLGGQIDVMFTTVASAASLVAAGQLRALAVTSAERSAAFPQLPTVAEAGVPGYAAESWYGLYAPAKTPAPVIARLNQAVAKAVQSGGFKQLEANEGLIMVGGSPEELDRYVGREEERWRKLVKDANIEVQ